ncbi:hypothetical protein [Rhodococcus sp. BS-15]|uniref:hypothetical protein n=1 Tax=Rhodococcus sp. BS-15 TaxID=1304954 RepID=UPI000FFB9EC4|nr:hypothetical protein [Rhodococcus sp. BS-15]
MTAAGVVVVLAALAPPMAFAAVLVGAVAGVVAAIAPAETSWVMGACAGCLGASRSATIAIVIGPPKPHIRVTNQIV